MTQQFTNESTFCGVHGETCPLAAKKALPEHVVHLPIYTFVGIDQYQMYPGTEDAPGIHHDLGPGLHLIAGVNGLGKSTFLLMLYHGLVGPAAIRQDDFGVSLPELSARRDADKFRRRVPDGAKTATCKVNFRIGKTAFEVVRSLYDLSLLSWKMNGAEQDLNDTNYMQAVAHAMNVGSFADVLIILNLIVFMFESRGLLMWSPHWQRNALRALFMSPADGRDLAEKAQVVATANSAYRNLLYIVNRDRKQLAKDKMALAATDALSAEYHTLQGALSAHQETYTELVERLTALDEERTEARSTLERAKFAYDDTLREIEALKLARVAQTFPRSDESSRYVLARLIGDSECLACGATDGPLIQKWSQCVTEGSCLICGTRPERQEVVVPHTAIDSKRLARAEERLGKARQSLGTAEAESKRLSAEHEIVQTEIDTLVGKRTELEKRVRQITGVLPPTPPAVQALEERVTKQSETLEQLRKDQSKAEATFTTVFERFRTSVERKADAIKRRFGEKIAEFLVEKAEISLDSLRGPIGESGQSYDWPTFKLSMTSGTFDSPAARRTRAEVSMSQGEFIDLAFRLALVEAAAGAGPASMIFDAPEASLDALFMRRAGAFLSEFTRDNAENRLIVTSNLTNADMIPALFGAYIREEGDPVPHTIPRAERLGRVVDLLSLAAPTSAVSLVGDRYANLLDQALFPPLGQKEQGL